VGKKETTDFIERPAGKKTADYNRSTSVDYSYGS